MPFFIILFALIAFLSVFIFKKKLKKNAQYYSSIINAYEKENSHIQEIIHNRIYQQLLQIHVMVSEIESKQLAKSMDTVSKMVLKSASGMNQRNQVLLTLDIQLKLLSENVNKELGMRINIYRENSLSFISQKNKELVLKLTENIVLRLHSWGIKEAYMILNIRSGELIIRICKRPPSASNHDYFKQIVKCYYGEFNINEKYIDIRVPVY